MTLSEQKDAILANIASGVESTSVDGLAVKTASLQSQIEAHKYLSALEAQQQGRRRFLVQVFKSPGAGHGT